MSKASLHHSFVFVLLSVFQRLLILLLVVKVVLGAWCSVLVIVIVDICCFDIFHVVSDDFDVLFDFFPLVHVFLIRDVDMDFVCGVIVEGIVVLWDFVIDLHPNGH